MRQTIKEIESNYAYRWFIGYDIGEDIPHFSTFGKNYSRRFKETDIFERILTHILNEAINCGFVDEKAVFVDGTHIKASANKRKSARKSVPVQAKKYQKQLDEEVEADRESHHKKPLTKKGFFKKYDYVYDEYYDCMICPANEILSYSTTNREGYGEYKSDPEKCSVCPFKEKCTESKTNQKVVMRHIWEKYIELVEEYRHTPEYSDIYKLRK